MLILDTDHLSILDLDTIEAFTLGHRLSSISPEEPVVTIITYEEQMRGWLAYIAQAKTQTQQIAVYQKLRQLVDRFSRMTLLDYDAEAARHFEQLTKARVRIGTMDLRIAAICLANDATLLTRNSKDFGQVPGLKTEDWSA